MNKPFVIRDSELAEIMKIPAVIQSYGLEKEDTVQSFRERVYGARFRFITGTPGYTGDLYILHGEIIGEPIMTFIKQGGAIHLI